MQREVFGEIVTQRVHKIVTTLASKGKEYSTDEDVFHNFKSSSKLANESNPVLPLSTPESELGSLMRKHLVSIFDTIDWHLYNEKKIRLTIDEKIGDAINYLILLEGLLNERLHELSGQVVS